SARFVFAFPRYANLARRQAWGHLSMPMRPHRQPHMRGVTHRQHGRETPNRPWISRPMPWRWQPSMTLTMPLTPTSSTRSASPSVALGGGVDAHGADVRERCRTSPSVTALRWLTTTAPTRGTSSCAKFCPVRHQRASLLQQRSAPIGGLDSAGDRMRQGRFAHLICIIGFFAGPGLECRTEAVDGDLVAVEAPQPTRHDVLPHRLPRAAACKYILRAPWQAGQYLKATRRQRNLVLLARLHATSRNGP